MLVQAQMLDQTKAEQKEEEIGNHVHSAKYFPIPLSCNSCVDDDVNSSLYVTTTTVRLRRKERHSHKHSPLAYD